MSNETSNYQNTGFSSEANGPIDEANASNTMGKISGGAEAKLKEYGKKSLAPLIELVHKYNGEIDPYFVAIGKGLDGAVNAFNNASSTQSAPTSFEGGVSGNISGDSSITNDFSSTNASVSSPTYANDAEKAVATWFRDASEWFSGARERLESNNAKDLLNYLEEQAARRPGLMFSSSYLVGVALGRFGRHLTRQKIQGFTGESSSDDFLKH